MDVPGTRAPRWITAGLAVVLAWSLAPAAASAETASFDVGDQAVVNVFARGLGSDLTVRTWDRSTVQVESTGGVPVIDHRMVTFGTERMPLADPIPPMQYTERENGEIVATGTLAPEEFPFAAFRPGPHDVVRINADPGVHVVVTVPATTGLLRTIVRGGVTVVDGYHGANLYMLQGQGHIRITGTTTTAFAQMSNGRLSLADSSFDRIRVRSNGAQIVFEGCRSKQIEASSVSGSIVYDGGSFDPGLARFDSISGSIALGVAAPALLAGRSQDGHVYTSFDRRTPVDQAPDGTATATFNGGGPLVNAISGRGNVYLYEGSLTTRPVLPPEWRPLRAMFRERRFELREGTSAVPPRRV